MRTARVTRTVAERARVECGRVQCLAQARRIMTRESDVSWLDPGRCALSFHSLLFQVSPLSSAPDGGSTGARQHRLSTQAPHSAESQCSALAMRHTWHLRGVGAKQRPQCVPATFVNETHAMLPQTGVGCACIGCTAPVQTFPITCRGRKLPPGNRTCRLSGVCKSKHRATMRAWRMMVPYGMVAGGSSPPL